MPDGGGPNMAALMAARGRGRDTMAAHLTRGEIVVPPGAQTPEVKRALLKAFMAMRKNPQQFVAGSPAQSRNPDTGAAQFDQDQGPGLPSISQLSASGQSPAQVYQTEMGATSPPGWNTSTYGQFEAFAPGVSVPSGATDITNLGGAGTSAWIPGTTPFSIAPGAPDYSNVVNWLTDPGSSGFAPITDVGGGENPGGSVGSEGTSVDTLANSPLWTPGSTPGTYDPTQAGISAANATQAQYEAGQGGLLSFPYVLPGFLGFGSLLTAGIGAGALAGDVAGAAAGGLGDVGGGEALGVGSDALGLGSASTAAATGGDIIGAGAGAGGSLDTLGLSGADAAIGSASSLAAPLPDIGGATTLGTGTTGAGSGLGTLAGGTSLAGADPLSFTAGLPDGTSNAFIGEAASQPIDTSGGVLGGNLSLGGGSAAPVTVGGATGADPLGGATLASGADTLGGGDPLGGASLASGAGSTGGSGGVLSSVSNALGLGKLSPLQDVGLAASAIGAGKDLTSLVSNPLTNDPGYNQLVSAAKSLSSSDQALLSPITTGQLPPQYAAVVTQATQSAKAAIRSQYANLGLTGSTMETQALNSVDQQALTTTANIASQMFTAGLSEAQLSDQIFSSILGQNVSLDNETTQSITNLASALSRYGTTVPAGTAGQAAGAAGVGA